MDKVLGSSKRGALQRKVSQEPNAGECYKRQGGGVPGSVENAREG